MQKYVIIGDGAAGTTAAKRIRESDPGGSIEIYADDPTPAYFRAALTNYLIGELREDQIWAVPPTFYSEFRVRRFLAPVNGIDFKNAQISLARDGRMISYDRLLIATGSRPRSAPFKNAQLPGVMTMRTLQDVRALMDKIKLQGLKKAVIIGGGPLALEWAQGMHERGVQVTILLRGSRFMPGSLDHTSSDLLLARLRHGGIRVLDEEEAESAIAGPDGRVSAVLTKSGKTVPCDLVGVAIGVIPNTEFLKGSALNLSARGDIVVDRQLRTNIPNVFAAGDVAIVDGQQLQLWEPARWHGHIAGQNMAGGNEIYQPGTPYIATRLFDLDFAVVGKTEASEGEEELVYFPTGTGSIVYRKAVLKNGVLIGALMLGERKEGVRRQGRAFKQAIDQGQNVEDVKDRLLAPYFDLRNWMSNAAQLEKPVQVEKLQTMVNINRSQLIKMPVAGILGAPEKKKILSLPEAQLRDEAGEKSYTLGETMRIGRAADNDIVVDDSRISRYHAEIRWEDDRFFVHDLKSRNGTYVNDQRITSRIALQPDGFIRVGQTRLVFNFVTPESADAVPAAASTIVSSQTVVSISEKEAPHTLMTVGLATQTFNKIQLETPAGASEAHLEFAGRHWPLTAQTTLIGREDSNDIPVNDPMVSHVHAQISRHGNDLYLQDLGSRNGTWANNSQISVPHKLTDGDLLRFGRSEIVFKSGPALTQPPDKVIPIPLISVAYLVLQEGPVEVPDFKLEASFVVIGRDADQSRFFIDHSTISRQHAAVNRKDGAYMLADKGSTNGTFLNDKKISEEPVELHDGDVIGIGQKIKLRFTIRQEKPSDSSPQAIHEA